MLQKDLMIPYNIEMGRFLNEISANGSISINYLREKLEENGYYDVSTQAMKYFKSSVEENPVEVKKMFQYFDINRDGFVTKREFVEKMMSLDLGGRKFNLTEIEGLFGRLVTSSDERISLDDFKIALGIEKKEKEVIDYNSIEKFNIPAQKEDPVLIFTDIKRYIIY